MKTTTIGRETPILTYQLFLALAHRNAEEQRKRERIAEIKRRICWWRKEDRP
jgi:hypothetical protein